ncbi:hypothetical protein F4804DRAFT_189953 [Jackrogersella minutella]|nr:hypothetical protein F4804DRAFT_189953 [Jackrogersella minutella]
MYLRIYMYLLLLHVIFSSSLLLHWGFFQHAPPIPLLTCQPALIRMSHMDSSSRINYPYLSNKLKTRQNLR